ncbi:phosphotransferase family protein [Bacillus ndiopicus]|uniref:phosphotransferase family protein n=1 Tax=Bacillus ndiopicus TaxID=1347368 RepID=UPI0009E035A4|nr:aminoglycoside phosphotransferase family protein [Bacillus ndiopicus]
MSHQNRTFSSKFKSELVNLYKSDKSTSNKQNLIEYIKFLYPQLQIESYTPNDIGQNNDVFIINDSLVFRFPKYKKGIEQLIKETEILKYIRDFISVQIPNPIYSSLENLEIGKVFTGYELIKGVPFWKEHITGIESKELLKSLSTQLVQFLIELHTIPKDRISDSLKLAYKHPFEEMSKLYQEIEGNLFPFIRKEAQMEITQSFKAFLESDSVRNLDVTLIHGDFGAANIIWLPESREISGVIDFGNARLGDPAYDFAGILSSYGEDFFNMCIQLYPNGEAIAERVRFYKSTFALQEALHGFLHNDKQAFDEGIKEYK